MTSIPKKSQITKNSTVYIETKQNQGTGNLIEGIVDKILTPGESHPYGIKVQLQDGTVGRVKNLSNMSKSS